MSTTYLKTIVASLSLAFIAGCSSSGGVTQGNGEFASNNPNASNQQGGATATGLGNGNSVSGTTITADGVELDANGIPVERTLYFAFDSDQIAPKYGKMLDYHARYLQANPEASVVFKGHTDERGTREYNMALSERRANSVKRFMNMMNVPSRQMNVVAYGEERPAARGANEEAYSQNRRVVLSY